MFSSSVILLYISLLSVESQVLAAYVLLYLFSCKRDVSCQSQYSLLVLDIFFQIVNIVIRNNVQTGFKNITESFAQEAQ